MTWRSHNSRRLFCASIIFLFLSLSMKAGVKEVLNFGSPDGRWTIEARWIPDGDPVFLGHYAYDLRDATSGKTYFKERATDENTGIVHPHRLNACWSPGGRYVAISLYYGRIAYWVSIIDVSGKRPHEIALFPKKLSDYDDFLTSADRWLDDATLEIEAYQPANWSENHTATACKLVIRFGNGGAKIVKKEAGQP